MTNVDNVLHALWTRHMDGDYDKTRDKPLWMLLQKFVENNGGLKQAAIKFDVSGKDAVNLAERVKAHPKPKSLVKRVARRLLLPLMG